MLYIENYYVWCLRVCTWMVYERCDKTPNNRHLSAYIMAAFTSLNWLSHVCVCVSVQGKMPNQYCTVLYMACSTVVDIHFEASPITHTCTKPYTALEVITELAFVAACSSNLFEARLARMYFNVLMSLHVCLISLLMIQFALQWMKLDILWSRFEYSIECSILCVFVNMWDIHGKLMTKSNSPTSANSTHRYPCSMSLLALFPLPPSESKCTSFLSFTYPPLNPFVGSPNILEVLLAIENVKEPENGHTIYMEATNSSSCTCAPHA